MVRFEVYGVPQPQGSSRAFVTKTGRAVVTSANKNLRPWRDQVAWEAREAMDGSPPLTGAVCVEVVFWLARPKSVKRLSPTVKPDVDKLLRGVLDALTGVAFVDDAQVVDVDVSKRYCNEHVKNPCAGITVMEARV